MRRYGLIDDNGEGVVVGVRGVPGFALITGIFAYGPALFAADYLRVLLQPENSVLMANYWQFVNGYWGMVQGRGAGPGGRVLEVVHRDVHGRLGQVVRGRGALLRSMLMSL